MKKTLLSLIVCLFFSSMLPAQTIKSYTVMAQARVSSSPASIRLILEPDAGTQSYYIFRKPKDSGAWTKALDTLAGTDTAFTDMMVQTGKVYEYKIQKNNGSFQGYGYIMAGIDVPVVDYRGKVILVIDTTYASTYSSELEILKKDLVGDGWKYEEVNISRNDTVPDIKARIMAWYNLYPGEVKAVYLLGHVPIPYAGDFGGFAVGYAPDAHTDHVGAWPADLYYGDMDNSFWEDNLTTNTNGSRTENHNIPGDGKFDNTLIPTSVELQVGRVDLANMPEFSKSEQELLAQYLGKAHHFKHAQMDVPERALYDDNFGTFNGEAFASSSLGSFSAMFGPDQVKSGDFFTTLDTASYLFAYGCGGGSYTTCSGVGSTADFAGHQVRSVFTAMFGSYFGDWDVSNSFLRAPLASEPMALTSVWSGRPYWHHFPMALGENIGYCTRLTQNNTGLYSTNFFAGLIHPALMGDPTLRLHPVKPAAGISITLLNNNTQAKISWMDSPDSTVTGYLVYRSHSYRGTFQRLTPSPVSTSTFTDNQPLQGLNIYMVRAVKRQVSASGTYMNLSQGIFIEASGMTGVTNAIPQDIKPVQLSVYPNPARTQVWLSGNTPAGQYTLALTDMTGRVIWQNSLYSDGTWQEEISVADLSPGIYLLSASTTGMRETVKVCIQ